MAQLVAKHFLIIMTATLERRESASLWAQRREGVGVSRGRAGMFCDLECGPAQMVWAKLKNKQYFGRRRGVT